MAKILAIIAILLVFSISTFLFIFDDNSLAGREDSIDLDHEAEVVINDRYFATQINDINLNFSDYENKLIRLEGFTLYIEDQSLPNFSFGVARMYACCGPDDYPVGFVCDYQGTTPAEDSWIRVYGYLKKDSSGLIYLSVSDLIIQSTRGSDTVYS